MTKDGTVKMVPADKQKEYVGQGWRYGQSRRSKEACQKIKEAASGRA